MSPLCRQCLNGVDYCHLRELYHYFGRREQDPVVNLAQDADDNWHCDGYVSLDEEQHAQKED
jgi:hypothetical protein